MNWFAASPSRAASALAGAMYLAGRLRRCAWLFPLEEIRAGHRGARRVAVAREFPEHLLHEKAREPEVAEEADVRLDSRHRLRAPLHHHDHRTSPVVFI